MRGSLTTMAVAAVIVTLGGCSSSTPTGTGTSPSTATGTGTTTTAAAGLETLSGDEILAKAKAAVRNARSYRVVATASATGITATSDIVYVGDNARGTQTALGQTNEYIKIGDVLYVKASEAYWESRVRLDQLAQVVRRWVKVSATSPSHVNDLPRLDDMTTSGAAATGEPGTINGQPVITVRSADGTSTAHVAARGEPYLVRVEGTITAGAVPLTATFEFSEFGTATAIIEPPSGEVLDLT